MKNNKLTTYILLTLVITIWGYVIYTLVSGAGDDSPPVAPPIVYASETHNLDFYKWKDSLQYDSIRHSPFATDDTQPELTAHSLQEPMDNYTSEQYTDPLAFAPAIDIAYLGFIENQEKKQKIAIVQINGKQYYMTKNQTVDNLHLLRINENSIRIRTEFQTLTIDRQ